MYNLTKEQKQELLDNLGKRVVQYRDTILNVRMRYVNGDSPNLIAQEKYSPLSSLNSEQKEVIYDLISETITTTIFDVLDMIEAYDDEMKLILIKDGIEYDMAKISEKMGSEIACYEDTGWIQKFSKIGRFVL